MNRLDLCMSVIQCLLGRPVLTVCVDAYSGFIMGYFLTWEGGTYFLRDMMLNVIADNVKHCKKYGIVIDENEWSSKVLPAYRPELKGPAEKTFDMIQERFIPHLKGSGVVEPNYRERGSYDDRKG